LHCVHMANALRKKCVEVGLSGGAWHHPGR
jgi:hypothetical protein